MLYSDLLVLWYEFETVRQKKVLNPVTYIQMSFIIFFLMFKHLQADYVLTGQFLWIQIIHLKCLRSYITFCIGSLGCHLPQLISFPLKKQDRSRSSPGRSVQMKERIIEMLPWNGVLLSVCKISCTSTYILQGAIYLCCSSAPEEGATFR